MVFKQEVWWRPGGRGPFSLDPNKPRGRQIAQAAFQLGVILGGPALALITIHYYPFLIRDRTVYAGGLIGIAFGFLTSFYDDLPAGIPIWVKFAFRAGWGIAVTGLLLGIVGIANGYATPVVSREVAVVSKRETLERDPSRRTYYVGVRAWPGSNTVVELSAPEDAYDRLTVPEIPVDTPQAVLDAMADTGYVRLSVGKGRFGWEWLERVDVP